MAEAFSGHVTQYAAMCIPGYSYSHSYQNVGDTEWPVTWQATGSGLMWEVCVPHCWVSSPSDVSDCRVVCMVESVSEPL